MSFVDSTLSAAPGSFAIHAGQQQRPSDQKKTPAQRIDSGAGVYRLLGVVR